MSPVRAGLLVCGGLLATPAALSAQLPPPGSGTVAVSVQTIDNTGHRLTDGVYIDNGRSRNVSLFVDAELGLTRRIAVAASLPIVFARYTDDEEPPPFLPFLPVDQCRCWHGGFQDLGLAARLNLVDTLDHVSILTPVVEFGVPTHAYDYRGEAVVGRRLREWRVGVEGSHRLDPVSRRLTVSGRYTYAFVERTLDLPNNRSNLLTDATVRLTPAVAARGFVSWQWTHGGLRAGSLPGSDLPGPGDLTTPERLAEHDRLLRDNRIHVGGGVSYRLPRGQLFATFTHFASGTDTHAGRALTVGLTLPFRTGY